MSRFAENLSNDFPEQMFFVQEKKVFDTSEWRVEDNGNELILSRYIDNIWKVWGKRNNREGMKALLAAYSLPVNMFGVDEMNDYAEYYGEEE